MITPRRIRLIQSPDLAGYRTAIVNAVRQFDAATEGAFIVVPTAAAAAQLTRTIRERIPGVVRLPHIGTRAELYEQLVDRLPVVPQRLSSFEREAMLAAGAREAEEAGAPAPFHVRPALIAEMLALYDHVRRAGRTIDDFDRLLTGELEPAAESDRGAAQLLEQTRFLAASFRAYESRLLESGAVDEHAARAQLIATPASSPIRHVILAIGDRPFDTDGYWPADVTLLTTLPLLEHVDIMATSGLIEAGYLERLRLAFVEIEESPHVEPPSPDPTLIVPADGVAYAYRDREDELEGVAKRLKGPGTRDQGTDRDPGPVLDRTAIVVARPLPYLYLAREVFRGAGISYQALDTLPLAAEPYAAAVDLVLECVAANFTRRAITSLLRSPHFTFAAGIDLRPPVAALDAVMAEQRYLGGIERLRALVPGWTGVERPAAAAALAIAEALLPLMQSRPMVDQVRLLAEFLTTHDREHGARRRRARAAVESVLAGMARSYQRHDPATVGTVVELSATIRRWLGSQTFAHETADSGVRVLDAQAARFADLDDVQIMGLVEGEWPERARRNVFYPRSVIAQLEPSRPERIALHEEREQVRWARAAFRDLLGLPSHHVRLSSFALESEAVVEPSSLIDDVPGFALPTQIAREAREAREAGEAGEAEWARVRAGSASRDAKRFEGEAGAWTLPRVSVSRLERYMKCPFQFYVANVLQVAEPPKDETSRSPLERGRFLHELFETFFHEWQARGHRRITAALMGEARALFEESAGPALRSLPPAEAALERARLFGSAVGSGIADRVFAMEAERGEGIRERLMEYELDGTFAFAGQDGTSRDVRLRAKIDRVDLLDDGTFRLIDYKTKYVPDRREALQLPIYSACVRTSLKQTHGRDIPAREAMYLSFEGPRAVVPLEERGKAFDDLVAAAGHRLVAALDNIAAGHYPARPETKNLCTMCAFTSVCRTVGGAPGNG